MCGITTYRWINRFFLAAVILARAAVGVAATDAKVDAPLFCIGIPDGSPSEFGLVDKRWPAYAERYPKPIDFTVGKSKLSDWPYIHPSTHDAWAGSKAHTFTIHYESTQNSTTPLYLKIGAVGILSPSQISIIVNGKQIASRRLPSDKLNNQLAHQPDGEGRSLPLNFVLPAGTIKAGRNDIAINLTGGSWLIYDYVMLTPRSEAPKIAPAEDPEFLKGFVAGPLQKVEEVVFAVRSIIHEHWYANFGYLSPDENHKMYGKAGKLCKLNIKTGKLSLLVDDAEGSVRDPAVHYDGRLIVFSYRKGGTDTYHLYTINSDGKGLRQLTDGVYDDIEPAWLPDGGIVFISARSKRWVNCWLTQVANVFRCDADGKNIRQLSANLEHDNTPWPLPDGRIMYMRWEYVDRNQVNYHHLWTMNPDGTGQTIYFGNLNPGGVYIDGKPIPNSDRVAIINSPGHGATEHGGFVATVDVSKGPDDLPSLKNLTRGPGYRDVWPLNEDAFLAARSDELVAVGSNKKVATLFKLPKEFASVPNVWLHEPRPLIRRERERVIPSRVDLAQPVGRYLLDNAYFGRNISGLKSGEIKKLLVIESLPKPVNFTGGMDPMSYAGTFTLERVLGTVPVDPDGSAYFEAPAMRSLIFVALDEKDRAVKRMQSFTTVEPGETLGCVGCHEHRALTQQACSARKPAAASRQPSRIEQIHGVPDIPDFPRDVQPVLNRNCVACHNYDKREGGVILTGDHGPMFSHSFYTLTVWNQIADGRNYAKSNYAPRSLGSGGSPLMEKLSGSHHGVKASALDLLVVRTWLDCGAPYPGTYAALGCGMIGGYQQNQPVLENDKDWPTTVAAQNVFATRCASCHDAKKNPVPRTLSDEIGLSFWMPSMDDPRLKHNRHIVFNLTTPEKSLVLLAPLAKSAGGYGTCGNVFSTKDDADYRTLLAMCDGGKRKLAEIKRFDMPGFRPREEWVREMKRYGILPENFSSSSPIDVYEVEQRYWKSLWYQPSRPLASK